MQLYYGDDLFMNLISRGTILAFRGLRTGDQPRLLAGAALAALGLWLRSRRRPPELVYRRELRPGQSLVVRTRRGDEPPLVIRAEEA